MSSDALESARLRCGCAALAASAHGGDCLEILPHIPYIDDSNPLTRDDYLALKERVIDKLERMGLTDLRKHIVFESS